MTEICWFISGRKKKEIKGYFCIKGMLFSVSSLNTVFSSSKDCNNYTDDTLTASLV